jgi:hypothetical protein
MGLCFLKRQANRDDELRTPCPPRSDWQGDAPVSGSLAVVRSSQELSQPDAAWVKKHVPVLEVAKLLGLHLRRKRARCWRIENHRHGDADPSLHFYERKNRVRCFVCDMRGGHSNIDLVMGVLGIPFGEAVRWIAEHFAVPTAKRGRPVGSHPAQAIPHRVGVHGSEFEVLVRSGMFGQLSAPERSVLIALTLFQDSDTGLTLLSYAGIMRYAGVSSRGTVSKALKRLARLRVLEIHRGARVGLTRECSAYRVTLDDPKFLDHCDKVFQAARKEILEEREFRKNLRRERMQTPPRPIALNTNTGGGLRPPDPPCATTTSKEQEGDKPSTCEGLNLSTPTELMSNKSVRAAYPEIGPRPPMLSIAKQKQILRDRGFDVDGVRP